MCDLVLVPDDFARHTVEREGAAGKAWLDAVPDLVSGLVREWELTIRAKPMAGTVGLVWEVSCSDRSAAVLKVGWQDVWSCNEAAALREWAGNGAARLLESDDVSGSMLLERLCPQRSLVAEPLEEAVCTAAAVANRLHVLSSRGFAGVLDQDDEDGRSSGKYDAEIAHVRPAVEEAITALPSVLLHGDLHYENILWSGREWKAIDPKPASGPAEWDYIPLLRNRFAEYDHSDLLRDIRRRLDRVTEAAGGSRREAYLFVQFRALLDADYAHRIKDEAFEHLSSALVAATQATGEW